MTSESEDASRRADLLGRPLAACPLPRLTALARTTSSADSGLSEAARFLQGHHPPCKLVPQLGPKSTKSLFPSSVSAVFVGQPLQTRARQLCAHPIQRDSCHLCFLAADFGLDSFPEDDLLRGTAICSGLNPSADIMETGFSILKHVARRCATLFIIYVSASKILVPFGRDAGSDLVCSAGASISPQRCRSLQDASAICGDLHHASCPLAHPDCYCQAGCLSWREPSGPHAPQLSMAVGIVSALGVELCMQVRAAAHLCFCRRMTTAGRVT